jgi:esterase/lipase
MGGYTAVKLLEYYPVKNLILVVPAMYDSKAYKVSFNNGFTEIIRRPQSWGDSDAWQILSEYEGRLFIIAAEKDNVIPLAVVNKIYNSAVNAEKRFLFIAPQATHAVFTDLRTRNPEMFCSVFGQIVEILA